MLQSFPSPVRSAQVRDVCDTIVMSYLLRDCMLKQQLII